MTRPTPPDGASPPLRDGSLTLRLLGEPCLCGPGEAGAEQRILGVGKPLALLTYLAVSPQHEATRDFLADLLWGGDSVSDPAHSLRNALVSIKNVVGPDVIEASASRCRLRRLIPSDLDALEDALRDGRLDEATARYTGEFFAGFAAPGCQQFELWCESVRHRLRTDVANAADVLARQLLDAGHARDAVQLARRMAEIEPFGQRARRTLLEALISAGDDLGALTEAAVMEQWLQTEELEAEPATKTLIAQARKGRSTGRRTSGETRSPLTPDLIGREAEFTDIVAAWERARSSGPVFVAVTAGAGVGKSRLLADAANRLRAERGRVVEVRALPGERELPFALLAALVAALAPLVEAASVSKSAAQVLASLDPSLADRYAVTPDTGAGDLLLRRAFALRELLGAIAERKATAVFIDDLHWADEASVDAVLAALTRLSDSRVLIVTASRPGVRHPLPPERTETRTLHPLSTDQLGQLIASIRPLPNESWATDASRCLQVASGGIPLFAILALRGAEDASLLVAGETEWACPDPAALFGHLTQGTVLSQSLRDISPPAARALALLALAGRAVPVSFLHAAATEPATGTGGDALADLERRALIIRQGDRCVIAHDLVTEATLAALSEIDRVQWSRELGAVMLATEEQPWIERGVRLLADVERPDALARRLTPVLRSLPVAHGVSMPVLLSSWLGQAPQHQAAAAAVSRHLPVTVRLRPFRRRLLAVGAFGFGALLIGAWRAANPAPQPDAELRLEVVGAGDDRRVVEVPLRDGDWDTSVPLPFRSRSLGSGLTDERARRSGPLVSYAAGVTLAEQVFDDSGASDVVRIDAAEHRTRLTSAIGDDVPYSWSPDGRFVAFSSSRWSPARQHRVAILEVATGRVRPGSRGDGLEDLVLWSPDGSRLAFSRRFLDGRPAVSCIVDYDGANERCHPRDLGLLAEDLGWLDDSHLLVLGSAVHGDPGLYSLAVDSAWSEHTIAAQAWTPTLSPNRRWLAWRTTDDAQGQVRVAPTADLARTRTLALDLPGTVWPALGWTSRGASAPYLEALAFDAPPDTFLINVPHRVPVVAIWSDGSRSAAKRLRWSVDDSATARVDTLGAIVARRPGRITLTASAGGWRVARHTFVAVPQHDSIVVCENWRLGPVAWRLFGDPQPQVVGDRALDMALSNEGDGTYFSGAYLKRRFDVGRGIAVDAMVRTPMTEYQWQSLLLGLHALNNSAALERWDHRTGYMPLPSMTRGAAACSIQYPRMAGIDGLAGIVTSVDTKPPVDFDARKLASGTPWRIRIQVLPDGRCGVAVNGRAFGVSNQRFDPGVRLLLHTYGSSWHSRMLLGPITISEGVPSDIDWTSTAGGVAPSRPSAPNSAARRTTPRSPK
ncbi:MAG: AAA family ATPase [Gemmatimonadaceae bacterium]|jgi:DNA-binding SARP family transcriptional activator